MQCTKNISKIQIFVYFLNMHIVGVKGLGVHIYICIGPGALFEDIKWSKDE